MMHLRLRRKYAIALNFEDSDDSKSVINSALSGVNDVFNAYLEFIQKMKIAQDKMKAGLLHANDPDGIVSLDAVIDPIVECYRLHSMAYYRLVK